MKFAALLLLSIFSLSCALHAQLRVHRIDKLGENSPSSPFFDHTEARAEASVVFPELAKKQGWDFTQSGDSGEVFRQAGCIKRRQKTRISFIGKEVGFVETQLSAYADQALGLRSERCFSKGRSRRNGRQEG